MDVKIIYFETILVSLSLVLTVGYHAYLWYCFKHKPHVTSIGLTTTRRRKWAQTIIEDCDEILAVQSGRNSVMGSILTSVVSVLLISSLAAITNNTYNASHLLDESYSGSQSIQMLSLKYGSVALFLLFSFVSSSMAIGCLNEANFLFHLKDFEPGYVLAMMERGFLFAFVGNRILYITVPLLLWMFGPLPMVLSSVASVWMFYDLDFALHGLQREPTKGVNASVDDGVAGHNL